GTAAARISSHVRTCQVPERRADPVTSLQLIPAAGPKAAGRPGTSPSEAPEVVRDLVERAQQGDVAAFELLIAVYQQQVYAFALAFTGDPEQAKDLAQEALVKTYGAIGSFRFQSSFGTWLYAVVRNVFRDHQRGRAMSEQRRARPLLEADLKVVSDEAPADEQLIAEESRRAVLAAMDRVPEPYREALFFADVQGWDYQEIAAVLRIAVGTVKSRVNRGRE